MSAHISFEGMLAIAVMDKSVQPHFIVYQIDIKAAYRLLKTKKVIQGQTTLTEDELFANKKQTEGLSYNPNERFWVERQSDSEFLFIGKGK